MAHYAVYLRIHGGRTLRDTPTSQDETAELRNRNSDGPERMILFRITWFALLFFRANILGQRISR